MENTKKVFTIGIVGLIVLIIVVLLLGAWTVVSPQEKAIIVRLGSIERTLDSGFNLKLPIIEKSVKIDVSTNAIKGSELAYSKDAQTVSFEATVTYAPDPLAVSDIYRKYKKDYQNRVIVPAIKDAIKSVASQYTAQGIIDNRSKLAPEMKASIQEKISDDGFFVSAVEITNIDFDDAYEEAIKQKQIAEQNALQQVNVTKQEEEKKKQQILQAEALAEKTRLEAQALASQNGSKVIEKLYAEAAVEAAKRWNGVLPTQMIPGGTLPFIQVGR